MKAVPLQIKNNKGAYSELSKLFGLKTTSLCRISNLLSLWIHRLLPSRDPQLSNNII